MDLKQLDDVQLKQVAEDFAVDYDDTDEAPLLLAKIIENGVTQAMYDQMEAQKVQAAELAQAQVELAEIRAREAEEEKAKNVISTLDLTPPEPVEAVAVAVVPVKTQTPQIPAGYELLYMTRGNPTYQIRGYTFTKANPYVLVKSVDVHYIMNHEGYESGFRPASAQEAAAYYS